MGRDRERAADRRLGARLGLAALAAAVFAVPFAALLVLVRDSWAPLAHLDEAVAERLHGATLARPWLADTLTVVSYATSPWVFRVAVLAAAVVLWRRGARRPAVWAAGTMALGGTLGGLVKVLVARARPTFDEPIYTAAGYSFPSGHALNSLLGCTLLLLLLLPVLRDHGRTATVAAVLVAATVVLLTGYDRVGLGVHYVSDVLAGWTLALATVAATTVAFEAWRQGEGRTPSPVTEGVDPAVTRSRDG
jgi:undecaprenyl-diphosphatase